MHPKQWIFLRGLTREHAHWGDFLDFFDQQFPGSKIKAIDFPGTGAYLNMTSPASMTGIADFVWERAREEFPRGPIAFFAISMGGMVTMEIIRKHEQDVLAAILVNASSRDSSVFHRLRYQIWPQFLKAVMKATQAKERERLIIDMNMNSETAREKAWPAWTKIAHDRPISPMTFARQLWAASQFSGLQKKPSTPVLLLNSLGDRFVDPSCSETLHQKFQWKLQRHPWGGHDLVWDDPQWVSDQIREFFA